MSWYGFRYERLARRYRLFLKGTISWHLSPQQFQRSDHTHLRNILNITWYLAGSSYATYSYEFVISILGWFCLFLIMKIKLKIKSNNIWSDSPLNFFKKRWVNCVIIVNQQSRDSNLTMMTIDYLTPNVYDFRFCSITTHLITSYISEISKISW